MEATFWDTCFQAGQAAFEQGDLLQAQEAFSAAVDAAGREDGSESKRALSLNNLAAVRQAQGHHEEALSISQEALRVSRAALGDAHAEVGVGWTNLAQLLAAGQRFGEAEAAYQAGLDILRRVEDQDPYRMGLESYASMLLAMERLPRAVEAYEELRGSLAASEPPLVEWTARTLHVLSNLYDALGEPVKAADSRQQCLSRLRELWGPSVDLAEVVLNMADSLYQNSQFSEAADCYEEGGSMLVRLFPAEDPRILAARMNALAALKEAGELDRAASLAAQLIADSEPGSPELPRLHNERGLLLFLHSRFEEAVGAFQQAAILWEQQGGQSPATRSSCLYNLASAALGAERWELALDSFRAALSLAEEHLSSDHALTERILFNYQHLLEKLGRVEESRELALRLEKISRAQDS